MHNNTRRARLKGHDGASGERGGTEALQGDARGGMEASAAAVPDGHECGGKVEEEGEGAHGLGRVDANSTADQAPKSGRAGAE
eukprot:764708-Hanusia_phi.AAC.6